MKYTLVLITALLFASFSSFAQEETKKVIIIKKVKDDNGKVTTEKIKADGKEADELLKELKKDGALDGIDIDVEIEKAKKESKKGEKKIVKSTTEDIRIEKSIVNGEESTTYTITTNNGGNKEVMVWAGEGEMPAEMAKKIKEHEMEQIDAGDGEHMIFIGDDGKTEVLKEVRIEVASPNKVSLGVMIDDTEGVVINEVVGESAAEKAGLKSGDIILKIDNDYTFNLDMLMKALSKFDKGDGCKVRCIRDGKEVNFDVRF